MVPALPAKLKASADISRFAHRAAQLEKFKPVIAYWCEYYIIQQILSKSLHNADESCLQYTTELMDKLERIKSAQPDNDAIVDDVAAKAYVEQFALETFVRADGAIRTNTVTAQTADTFRAAATFFDMLGIWGPLDQDAAQKSKYAKYHALRIAKAIKAGEDPNASNPVQEESQTDEAPLLDPNDPEVMRINGSGGPAHQPTVESVPESMRSSPAFPMGPSKPPLSPIIPTVGGPLSSQPFQSGDVSPISPPELAEDSRKGSVSSAGGGYFPRMATFSAEPPPPIVQSAAPDDLMGTTQPPFVPPPAIDPQSFYQPQPPIQSHPSQSTSFPPDLPHFPSQQSEFLPPGSPMSTITPQAPQPPIQPPQQPMFPGAAPQPPQQQQYIGPESYRTDDAAMNEAQKHARWAVSALAFEDVETAVKELRIALSALGAR